MQQEAAAGRVLALNGGSSSIKFAVHDLGETSERGLHGHLDRSGPAGHHAHGSWRRTAVRYQPG